MNIEDSILYFKKRFSKLSPRATYDTDNRGEDFAELFLANDKNISLPITVKITDYGCHLSVGRMHNVMGNKPISVEACASAIEDVISDKIVFVFGYKNQDDFDDSKVSFSRFFALTEREDDMSEEYKGFLATLEKKPSWFERKLGNLTGIFEISCFNDETPKIVKRI